KAGMRRVVGVRRGHVDDVDRTLGAQLLHGGQPLAAKVLREPGARLRPRIGRGDEGDARIGGETGRHERESAPEPGDADVELAHWLMILWWPRCLPRSRTSCFAEWKAARRWAASCAATGCRSACRRKSPSRTARR